MLRPRQPRPSRPRCGALLVVLLLPVASLAAAPQFPQRGQRGGSPLEEAMQAAQQEEVQRFGATVSRVRVDVIVTDGNGSFVDDLTAADFTVYEDGEPQEILDVQLVDLAAGEVHPLYADQPPNPTAAESPATGETGVDSPPPSTPEAPADNDAEAPSASPASELGAVIFLVDGPSLSVQTRARFGDAWEDLLDQTDTLQVPRAAYMVDNAGRLQELSPLGYDVERMRAAAQTVREAPFFGNMTRLRLIELANDVNDPNLGDDASRIAASKARSWEGQERSRALATYELLTNFADALWSRSGRTAVVWVSTGIKLMQGGPYNALLNAGDYASPSFDAFSPDPAIFAAQEELHRAANGSNVSLYTVDPSLLAESRFADGDVEVRTMGAAGMLNANEVQQSLDGLRDAMRTAAAETGGESFIHATDLRMVLEEIEADTSRFYLVTYAPPSPDGDGTYHAIEVDVGRDDTSVRARGGYVDHAPEDRAARLITAALALPGSVTDLPVEAEAFRSRPGPTAPNVLLAVAVDGSQVGLMLTQQGEQRVSLDIHAVAVRGDEVVAESHEELSARSRAGGAPAAADADNPLNPTLVGYMAYQREWTLTPGSYTMNVAVFDNVTGRIGASSLQLEIPDVDDSWGVSDPLLVTLDDAGRPQPIVHGRVLPDRNLAAFIEVYGGIQPILSGQVLLEGSDEEQQQGAKLFPIALRRVAGATHRGSAPLPPGMPPGHYVVQLVITDPPAEQHRIVRLPVEVVAPPQR